MASKIKATTAVSIDDLITAFDDLASCANTLNLLPLRVNVARPLQLRLADGICTGPRVDNGSGDRSLCIWTSPLISFDAYFSKQKRVVRKVGSHVPKDESGMIG